MLRAGDELDASMAGYTRRWRLPAAMMLAAALYMGYLYIPSLRIHAAYLSSDVLRHSPYQIRAQLTICRS